MKSLQILLITFLILGLLWIFKIGIEKNEKVECAQWKEQSEEYPLYYTTDWQKEQCKQFGLEFVN